MAMERDGWGLAAMAATTMEQDGWGIGGLMGASDLFGARGSRETGGSLERWA